MADRTRRRVRKAGAVNVVDLPSSVMLDAVRSEVETVGLRWDRFVALGMSDDLEGDRLRDLWLMVRPIID